MKKIAILFFLFCIQLCGASQAFAFLPPAYFIVQKIIAEKDPLNRAVVKISVSKPAENTKSPEVLLGDNIVNYPAPQTENDSKKSSWPALAIFLESNEEFMLTAWKNFGLPIKTEADLLRYKKEQYEAAKDMPSPFYKIDHSVSLKRYKNTYAFVSSDHKKEKSIWVEKDGFTPLAIRGPCPDDLSSVADLKGTEGDICELQYDRSLFQKKSNARIGKILLKKGEKTLLIFRVTKILVNPSDAAWNSSVKSELESIDANQQPHALIHYFF